LETVKSIFWRYHRGEIYYVDLNPCIGSEQGGIRPVVVLQNNIGNRSAPTLIIAPLTKQLHKRSCLPTHVPLAGVPCLKYDSVVLLEQIRVIDKRRIRRFVGCLTEEQMQNVDSAIRISLALDATKCASAACICVSTQSNFTCQKGSHIA
jgi:mRNA-degrading endonuclease toxin of MazEF toxin-antitoxin module